MSEESFIGHAIPASAFMILAAIWVGTSWKQFFHCLRSPGQFRFRCNSYSSKTEVNFKIISGAIGIIVEIVGSIPNNDFDWGNVQHIAMYLVFSANGLTELGYIEGLPVPEGADYVTLALAFLVEGFLFFFHSHGRSFLGNHLHYLLSLAIFACMFATLLEMTFRDHAVHSLVRAACTMFQGTWFFQIAFILHNPFPWVQPWIMSDHEVLMITTALFAWHFIGAIIFVILAGLYTYRQQSPWIYIRKNLEEY